MSKFTFVLFSVAMATGRAASLHSAIASQQTTGTQAIMAVCHELGEQVPALLITGDTAPVCSMLGSSQMPAT